MNTKNYGLYKEDEFFNGFKTFDFGAGLNKNHGLKKIIIEGLGVMTVKEAKEKFSHLNSVELIASTGRVKGENIFVIKGVGGVDFDFLSKKLFKAQEIHVKGGK